MLWRRPGTLGEYSISSGDVASPGSLMACVCAVPVSLTAWEHAVNIVQFTTAGTDTSSHKVTVTHSCLGVYGVHPEHTVLLRSLVVFPAAPWELVAQHALLPRAAVEWGGVEKSSQVSSSSPLTTSQQVFIFSLL